MFSWTFGQTLPFQRVLTKPACSMGTLSELADSDPNSGGLRFPLADNDG